MTEKKMKETRRILTVMTLLAAITTVGIVVMTLFLRNQQIIYPRDVTLAVKELLAEVVLIDLLVLEFMVIIKKGWAIAKLRREQGEEC